MLLGTACLGAPAASAQPKDVARLALPSELAHLDFVWARAEGDLNGDAIPDLALVLTGSKGEGPREERLVVLLGDAQGRYRVLSVSGELCHPGKFYNLDIARNSVFLQAVEYADSARLSAFTLQFRYSAARQDLELIGEQTTEESYDDNASYKTSTNYLTRTAVHTRQAGKRHKEARARLTAASSSPAPAALRPLQQFDCRAHGLAEAPIHIGEDFRVQQNRVGAR